MNDEPSLLPPMPCKENICGILVSFFPSPGFIDRLKRTMAQVDHVVIVDNTPDRSTSNGIRASLPSGISFLQNFSNRGIAAALNQGIELAREKAYPWALLLDQDSVPWPNTIEKLVKVYDELPDKQRLVAVGCNRFLKARAKTSRSWITSRAVITSGTLLALDAALKVGPFREEFFIDCVDFEFCLRARSQGLLIIEFLEPIMDHVIGNPKPARLLWFRGRTSNYKPERWYYIVRNNLILTREYFWKEFGWALPNIFFRLRDLALVLLVENLRRPKFKYAFLGFMDGMRRRFDRTVL